MKRTSPKLCLGEVEARARARLREGAFRDADLCTSVTSPLPQSRLNASPATVPQAKLGGGDALILATFGTGADGERLTSQSIQTVEFSEKSRSS